MPLFFTADTHFGDHRTINIQRRAFATVAQMDAAIVAGWNAFDVGVDARGYRPVTLDMLLHPKADGPAPEGPMA